jgi:Glycosyl hydrolase catalytic core
MIDGVKAVDPSAKILMCSTSWMHYGFTDMLSAGTQPDGTRGHPVPHWDITAWHWYSDMKDITDAHGINILQHMKESYGKPIWITEYGVRPGLPEYLAEEYLVGKNALAGFVANAKTYDIQNVDLYSLYDDQVNGGDGNYGVFENDAVTRKSRHDLIKNFISTHPMP